MKIIVAFILSQSILLPIIAGLIRYRRLGRSYQPFFLLLLIGFLTEVISFIVIQGMSRSNIIVVNIYVLIEWSLIAWQFYVWSSRPQKKIFYALIAMLVLFWIGENLVFHQINRIVPYFRFLYFFLIVLLSINKINYMITHENRNLFLNPRFLICIGFIIYFIFMIMYFWAYQVSLFGKSDISNSIIFLMGYVNVFTNIIYAIAFLMVPKPQKFTLQ